ncbi:oligoendopeptidase F [Candidatus Clavichlamydia salmonicola]|uniref:oligoendopeptidase F n=1 Tax=Candidatus Clavichlamydia salmonicola TaxID=469812 RepID=UPI0018918F02|nr:oligoendopeptidase F [Candidatus Clavichlamydia salmonicola]
MPKKAFPLRSCPLIQSQDIIMTFFPSFTEIPKPTSERVTLNQESQWNLNSLFSSDEEWSKSYNTVLESVTTPFWPSLSLFRNQLHDPKKLQKFLEKSLKIEQILDTLYCYAHLQYDTNMSDSAASEKQQKALTLFYRFQEEISWVNPELLQLPKKTIKNLLNNPQLATYKNLLTKIFRMQPHTKNEAEETLLSMASEAGQAVHKTFSSLSDTDLPFESILDSQGHLQPLSHGLYNKYLHSSDRVLRENASKAMLQRYASCDNTFSHLLQGKVMQHKFNARARNYASCLEAALFPHAVPVKVYTNLIEAAHSMLPLYQSYIQMKKEILGLSEMHTYDLYAPLPSQTSITMTPEEAIKVIIESLIPMGEEYCQILKKGLTTDRWVDWFEHKGKRSGAYSSGCYNSNPYILMNFQGQLRDVSTLAHEAGHSMHSYLSRKACSFHDAQYPIFLAEIASTFNEFLLNTHLQNTTTDPKQRITLLTGQIEDLAATFFRQAMFAEFELQIHQAAEKGTALTPDFLKNTYKNLLTLYFGDSIKLDPLNEMEWARIPHFYYNFYVYQYATGISSALFFGKKVLSEEPGAKERYLELLSSGGSDFPLELLKKAGADPESSSFFHETKFVFENGINELKNLLNQQDLKN